METLTTEGSNSLGDSSSKKIEEEFIESLPRRGTGDDAIEVDDDNLVNQLNLLSTNTPATCEEEFASSFEDDYIEIGSGNNNTEQTYFDSVIGAIEDIVMDEEFHKVQTKYLDSYWTEFSSEQTENLHIHFEMFKEYSQAISSFMEERLKSVLDNFDMEKFVEQLSSRPELDGDIFDMLFTLIDYVKFRELLLDYRSMMTGKTIDLSGGISCIAINPPSKI